MHSQIHPRILAQQRLNNGSMAIERCHHEQNDRTKDTYEVLGVYACVVLQQEINDLQMTGT